MYCLAVLPLLLISQIECKDTSGPVFLFSLPQIFSKEKGLFLYIVTTGNNPQISVKIVTAIDEREAAEFAITQKIFEKVNIVIMEEKFYSPIGEGLKPTIQVKATFPVQVFLFIMIGETMGALVKLLPIEGWGKEYYIVSLAMNPTVIVTAGVNKTFVTVTLTVSSTYMGSTQSTGPDTHFQLEMYESYSVLACYEKGDKTEGNFDSLTGSMIVATDAVGVITGSCFSKTKVSECTKFETRLSHVTDIALESGYPLRFWGKEFMTFIATYHPTDNFTAIPNGELLLMASQTDTMVEIGSNTNDGRPIYMKNVGNWVNLPHIVPQTIKASKPILAVFVMRPACEGGSVDLGNPSLVNIIPNRLFYTTYAMRIDDMLNFTAYFIVLFEGDFGSTKFQMKQSTVDPEQVVPIAGNMNWKTAFVRMPAESTEISLPTKVPFGCYVVYLGPKFGAITFADFLMEDIYEKPVSTKAPLPPPTQPTVAPSTGIASLVTSLHVQTLDTTRAELQTPYTTTSETSCVPSEQRPGDQVDNDCDGLTDEEAPDDQDNDGDGAVDEDTKTSTEPSSQVIISEPTTLEATNKDSILREAATQPSGVLSSSMSSTTGIVVVVVVLLVLLCLSVILNIVLFLRSKKERKNKQTDMPMTERDVVMASSSERHEF